MFGGVYICITGLQLQHICVIQFPSDLILLWSHRFIIHEDGGCVCKVIFRLKCNWIRSEASGDDPLALLCLLVFG